MSVNCFAETYKNEFVEDFFQSSEAPEYENIYEKVSFDSVFGYVLKIVSKCFKNSLGLFTLIISVILLMSLLNSFEFTSKAELKFTASSAVCIAVISIVLDTVKGNVNIIKEALESAKVFSVSAVPVITSLCISSSKPFSAGIFSVGISFCSGVFQFIADKVLMTFAILHLLLGICGTFTKDFDLLSVTSLIKKAFNWIIGVFISLFTFAVSMQSFLSNAADNFTKKSIQAAVGKFIPMIGGSLSSSIESIFALASSSKTFLGVLGIVAVISIFAPTIFGNVCYGAVMMASKHISGFFKIESLSYVTGVVADVFFMLSAIVSACAFMTIISFLVICVNI